MHKQPTVTEQTRKNLINSFWELYKKDAFNNITVSNICKIANYNRTTFYRYFNDINDLLSQLENDIISKIRKSISNSTQKQIGFAIDKFTVFNNNFGEYLSIFHTKNNISFYIKFKELVKNDVLTHFKFSIKDESKKEFIYEFLFASTINTYAYWFLHPNIISVEHFVDLLNNILTYSETLLVKE